MFIVSLHQILKASVLETLTRHYRDIIFVVNAGVKLLLLFK